MSSLTEVIESYINELFQQEEQDGAAEADRVSLRRKDVAEWFVVLDKAVAMQDWTKARQQAKWIMDHATLTGERVDVRRAADILATKIPSEETPKKK